MTKIFNDVLKEASTIHRAPDHIGLDITNQCNMKCLHCFNRSGSSKSDLQREELTDADIFQLAEDVRLMEPYSFCFCGGEPLLRIDAILGFLNRINQNQTHSSMVTNGFILNQEMARALKRNGLRGLQVSVDGVTAATHERMRGVDGAFDKALDAIRYSVESKIDEVAVAFSPTNFNIDEWPILADMLHKLKIHKLRVQPLMKLGKALSNEDIFPTDEQYFALHQYVHEARKKYRDMQIEWGDPMDHLIRFSRMLKNYVPYISIRSDGGISISPYLPIDIGNVRKHSISEYWKFGLGRIWTLNLFQDIANFMFSSYDFYRPDLPIPLVFYDSSISLDLIDDRLLELGQEDFNRLYWSRLVI
jgi:MoaA/NifB/PqqE/SkfB family radical SAM enzyme